MSKKPLHFLIFKIVGVVGVAVLVFAFYLIATGFGDFESNNFMIGGFLMPLGLFATVSGFIIGFKPEITKMRASSTKYVMEQNKGDLRDIANVSAEISKDAVSTIAGAVKEGVSDTIFCKHCGAKIDADSKFCSSCGKEQ